MAKIRSGFHKEIQIFVAIELLILLPKARELRKNFLFESVTIALKAAAVEIYCALNMREKENKKSEKASTQMSSQNIELAGNLSS